MGELRSLEEARDRILSAIPAALPSESVPVGESLGRVLATDVVSRVDLPPFDNGAMDGYAIRAVDVAGASEGSAVRLAVVGESRAGDDPGSLPAVAAGTAVRIATGAPLPPGADAVVQVELTTPIGVDGTAGDRGRDATGPLPAACLVHAAIPAGASVRRRGEDLRAGGTVVGAGRRVTPAVISFASGSGNPLVAVHRRPVVAVLATGDEVRAPGAPLPAGRLYDANGPGIAALVADAGATPLPLGIAPDVLETVTERLRAGIAAADVVVVSGGVSVGPYDVVKLAFEAVGRVDLWRVAVQPGKPFAFGSARAQDGREVLLFGLPGNPVSSFVTFELFVRPVLLHLAGDPRRFRPIDRAVLLDPAGSSPGRRTFVRVVAERDGTGSPVRDERGRVRVRSAGGQGSHMLSGLVGADALAVVPEAVTDVAPGDELELWWLEGR